jgi:hypothetical protein
MPTPHQEDDRPRKVIREANVRLCVECADLLFISFLWFFLKTFSALYIYEIH